MKNRRFFGWLVAVCSGLLLGYFAYDRTDKDFSLWRAYTRQGKRYYEAHDYVQALDVFSEALKISERSGSEDRRLATILNNIAFTYHGAGKDAEAIPLYQHALQILKATLRPDDPELSTLMGNLATAHRDLKQFSEAEPLYQEALRIQDSASLLESYAKMLRQAGRDAEAKAIEERVKSIQDH